MGSFSNQAVIFWNHIFPPEVSIEALGPPGPAVTIFFRDGMRLWKPKERIRFLGYQSYWEMVQVDWMPLFSQQSSSSRTLAKIACPKESQSIQDKTQESKQADTWGPIFGNEALPLSFFDYSGQGDSPNHNPIADSHQGCFVITPLIRLPN